jgi:hypothetical protein
MGERGGQFFGFERRQRGSRRKLCARLGRRCTRPTAAAVARPAGRLRRGCQAGPTRREWVRGGGGKSSRAAAAKSALDERAEREEMARWAAPWAKRLAGDGGGVWGIFPIFYLASNSY